MRSHFSRPAFLEGIRDMAPMMLGVIPFGMVCGVGAIAAYFLGTGALLWGTWQIATLAGIVAGQVIPASWQLEFVVPLCFLAVLVPLLRDRVSIVVFAIAAVAVVALDAMPLRLSMIC